MKRALVCGAGGFIGGHRLRQGDKETGRGGAGETRGQGDKERGSGGDTGTRGQREGERGRHGDKETRGGGDSQFEIPTGSNLLLVTPSPCLPVSEGLCLS